MSGLYSNVELLRSKYREVFLKAFEDINRKIEELRPDEVSEDIFAEFPVNSPGAFWQKNVLRMMESDILKDVYEKYREILAYRIKFKCNGCAACCNLACSEFSPEELKLKAENGDNFAGQFLSVFVPYNSKEEAVNVYPEYIEMLEKNKESEVYFYYCPKVTKDKRCSDYENRPQICRDFPDNPLSILPKTCGYKNWKKEVEPSALLLHSMVEIVEYYRD